MDTSTAAIQNGTFDQNNDFAATVRLSFSPAGEGNIGCSGTLISPVWVITAGHCFDTPARRQSDVTVATGPTGGQSGVIANHTQATSGNVITLDPGDRGTDLALVRLDAPVMPWVVQPVHPPVDDFGCGTAWGGSLVGYSGSGHDDWPYNGVEYSPCPDYPVAKYSSGGAGWHRIPDGDAAVFQHEYSGPAGGACTWFRGGTNGDSGGSLYKGSTTGPLDDMLCGVVSGQDWTDFSRSADLLTHYIDYNTAALDDPHNGSWWRARVLDEDGFFEGECGTPTPSNDPDGDGVPTLCDSCPQIYNPEQLAGGDDPDGDGIGAACDLCPSTATSVAEQQINRNAEIELALAYPQLEHVNAMLPLRLDAFGSQGAFENARNLYLSSFRPNACDPFPVPQQELNPGGSLPAVPSYPINNQICLAYTGGCETVVQNKIQLKWASTSTVPASTTGTVGLRWCDCQNAPGFQPDSVQGRARCRAFAPSNCAFNEANYGAGASAWRSIRTSDTFSWSGSGTLSREWPLSQNAPNQNAYFNFMDLPAASRLTGTNGVEVRGMLWAHTKALSPSVSTLPVSQVKRYANSLGDGNASHRLRPKGHQWVYVDDWVFCGLDCVEHFGRPYYEVSNPDWRVTYSEGLRPVVPPASFVALFDAVGAGSARFSPSSESLYRLRALEGGAGILRGVGLSNTNAITQLLTSGGQHDGAPQAMAASFSGGPTLDGREAVVVSGSDRSVFFFGTPLTTSFHRLKLSDLASPSGTWSSHPLPAGESFGVVLAASYRQEDRAIYFLQKQGGALMLRRLHALRRLPDGGRVQTLATFPATSAWSAFTNYSLALGANGDLVLAAHGSNSEKTRLGRFTFDGAHRMSLVGVQKLTTVTEGRMLLLPNAILASQALGGRSKTLSFATSAMPTPVTGDLPTWSAH